LYDKILRDASFPEALLNMDRLLVQQAKKQRCPLCDFVLDVGDFPRKPRGGPWDLGEEHDKRFGLCCRREGCRKRVLPPSVRFLGRKVYLSAVVVLAAVLRQGPAPYRVQRLQQLLGVDRRTLQRWRKWWTERVGSCRRFEIGRADFMPPPDGARLPLSLLDSFVGDESERLISMLRWLAAQFGSRFPTDDRLSAEDAR